MAGVSSKDIKNRIRSMESTKQITKAMELVAASKLRQAQTRLETSRPYFQILSDTIINIVDSNRDFSSPYLRRREGNRVLYIAITGDRGLAGGYNNNVLKLCVANAAGKDVTVLPIGKKAVDYFRSHKVRILTDSYAEAAEVSIGDCFSIAKALSRAYRENTFDQIHVVYTAFVSILTQTPTTRQMLPLVKQQNGPTPPVRNCVPVYEPEPEEVFASIVPEYLGGILYGALCESRCAEQAARRTAMDSATSNAEEMIADLRQTYNQARQALITQEITEIVAGSSQ